MGKEILTNCFLKRTSLYLGMFIFFIMTVGTISGLGFGSSYIPKVDGERILAIPINYNQDYYIYPQNSEDRIVYVKINITNMGGLIITELEDVYEVPPNTESDDFKIKMNIQFPLGVIEGKTYPLSYSVLSSYENSVEGVIQFSPVGYSKSFTVVAGDALVDNCIDNDGDGFDNCNPGVYGDDGKVTDCNNNDKDIYPNAPKLKDNKDNNCDGAVDDDEKKDEPVGDDDDDDDDSDSDDDDDWVAPIIKKNETIEEVNTIVDESPDDENPTDESPDDENPKADIINNVDDKIKPKLSWWKIIGGVFIILFIGLGIFVVWYLYNNVY